MIVFEMSIIKLLDNSYRVLIKESTQGISCMGDGDTLVSAIKEGFEVLLDALNFIMEEKNEKFF